MERFFLPTPPLVAKPKMQTRYKSRALSTPMNRDVYCLQRGPRAFRVGWRCLPPTVKARVDGFVVMTPFRHGNTATAIAQILILAPTAGGVDAQPAELRKRLILFPLVPVQEPGISTRCGAERAWLVIPVAGNGKNGIPPHAPIDIKAFKIAPLRTGEGKSRKQ